VDAQARLHPEQPANSTTRSDFDALWRHSTHLLQRGFVTGSILTVDAADAARLGPPWTRRYVYNHKRCGVCKGAVQSWDMANRTVYACTACQPLRSGTALPGPRAKALAAAGARITGAACTNDASLWHINRVQTRYCQHTGWQLECILQNWVCASFATMQSAAKCTLTVQCLCRRRNRVCKSLRCRRWRNAHASQDDCQAADRCLAGVCVLQPCACQHFLHAASARNCPVRLAFGKPSKRLQPCLLHGLASNHGTVAAGGWDHNEAAQAQACPSRNAHNASA
jgi:hypothetical protein